MKMTSFDINKRENYTYHVAPLTLPEPGGDVIRVMPQGGIAFVMAETDYSDKSAYISNLHVDEPHRRKGMGTIMMDVIESAARDFGCKLAILDVYTDSPKWLLDWYGRLGYKKVKSDDRTVTMQKNL